MEKTDLTFISTDDLVVELMKRHDACIVTGVKFTDVKGDYKIMKRYGGHHFSLLALATKIIHDINMDVKE